jgi:hypothetical protein
MLGLNTKLNFWDVPYSQSLNPGKCFTCYDDAATIYSDLLTRLNAATQNLTSGFGARFNLCWKPSFLKSLVIHWNWEWVSRIVDVPAMSAKAQSAITTAVSGGVFTKCRQCSFEIQSAVSNTPSSGLT